MHSKQAYILALMAGAGALIVVLASLLSLELLEVAEPYLSGKHKTQDKTVSTNTNAPLLTTKIEGSSAQIVEVDKNGQVMRVIFASDLNDQLADFSLLAVPQTTYNGKVYVQSVQDAAGSTLIIYPLSVATGKISPAVINVPSVYTTISPEQNHLATINVSPTRTITAYDLATGTVLASWTLAANERLTETVTYAQTYSGEGVRWTSNECFDHALWTEVGMEVRTFCLTN